MTERWLDEGCGKCRFRDTVNATLASETFHFYEDRLCRTCGLTVMPNHIHAIMIPFSGVDLETALTSIKGWIAKRVDKRFGTTGQKWAQGALRSNHP